MSGKIITIEGLDGCGKSTQIALMHSFLTRNNIKYKYIHYPRLNEGVYGGLIAAYLRGELGSLEVVSPKIVGLLFALDRFDHTPTIQAWLEEGYWIIMDRYVKSNIAFQCAKVSDAIEKQVLKDWINNLEFDHNKLPLPNLSFFLDVPFDIITSSLENIREGEDRAYLNGKTDIHEDSLSLQKEVLKEYRKLLEENSNFVQIDCCDTDKNWLAPEKIHGKILASLKAREELDSKIGIS